MPKNHTQIKIVLSVFGELFNPEDLSEFIGIKPTNFWIKGDVIPLRKGTVRNDSFSVILRKESLWEYSTSFVQTLFLDDVSTLIVEIFNEKKVAICNYIQQNALNVKIDIVVEIVKDSVPALTLNKQFLNFANRLNSEIDIDMYLLR